MSSFKKYKFLHRTMFFYMVFTVCALVGTSHAVNIDHMHLLRMDLLNYYDPTIRPVSDADDVITVKFGLSLNSLDVDDMRRTMSITSWMFMAWHDDFLHWNPSIYANITSIRMGYGDIWAPDVTLYNSISGETEADLTRVPLLASSNGDVRGYAPFVGEVPCDVNLKRWPSDVHTCVFKIGSWAHHSQEIKLDTMYRKNISLRMENYQENPRWKLLKSYESLKLEESGDLNQTEINFYFTVQRQSNPEALCLLQSSFAICVISLCSYMLPMHFLAARLLMHVCSLTLLVISDLAIMYTLPPSGNTTPYIMSYYAGLIILTTFSTIATVVFSGCFVSTPHQVLSKTQCSSSGIFKCLCSSPLYLKDYALVADSTEKIQLDPELNGESEVMIFDRTSKSSQDAIKILRILNVTIAICLTVVYSSLYLRMRGTIMT